MEQIPSNIKHMVSVAPRNTTVPLVFLGGLFFFLAKAPVSQRKNHCQLAPMNTVIDNQEAGQQIKCQL